MPRTGKKHDNEIDLLPGGYRIRKRSFSGHMSDMYSFPDTIKRQTIHIPRYGGFAEDARNIREYFRKALRKAGV